MVDRADALRHRVSFLMPSRRWPSALVLLIAIGQLGCATRDRLNPFDPANGTTLGRPVGFAALAGNRRVDLRWQSASGSGLLGFRLWQRTAPESAYKLIAGLLPPASSRYVSSGLLNDVDHSYRLEYQFADGTTSLPSEDSAMPGRAVGWVVDGARGELSRLTADGRRVAQSWGGFTAPDALVADTTNDHVWVSDGSGGRLWLLRASTGVLLSIPAGGVPGDLAVVQGDSMAWYCDEARNELRLYASTGALLDTLGGFLTPSGVALVPLDGTLWVADRDHNRVLHMDPDVGLLGSTPMSRPSRLARDAVTGQVWATSFTARVVVRLGPDGSLQQTLSGFGGPVGVAIDSRRGRIWVADLNGGRVVAFDRDGAQQFAIGGLPGPRSIAVDENTGRAWVACAEAGATIVIAPTGTVLHRLSAFESATGISVDGNATLPPPSGVAPAVP
ncbi:MAG: hypothetical protein HOP12_13705 [Candidatus Eisenbacteria bacterium]|uniref:Fibronectin type-III domain-containing protein n=1 Tax=Eiseniibacteriota bacterium TaxID=2212470 RepID=A0A849SQJ4_UNCEI|nr:hypothetical protein [Candidatus Eisenbacteria bacterium]